MPLEMPKIVIGGFWMGEDPAKGRNMGEWKGKRLHLRPALDKGHA